MVVWKSYGVTGGCKDDSCGCVGVVGHEEVMWQGVGQDADVIPCECGTV